MTKIYFEVLKKVNMLYLQMMNNTNRIMKLVLSISASSLSITGIVIALMFVIPQQIPVFFIIGIFAILILIACWKIYSNLKQEKWSEEKLINRLFDERFYIE
ncbi:MAG: hypothetical protein EBU90_01490 [Proteobacteria bacterium]|nr:hypothetical protein [Pseudomonadota bacterium]